MPASEEEATKRAVELKSWLLEMTGVEWKIRVHENLGWFYSLSYGTMDLSQYAKNYGSGGFMLLNGARGSGYGHMELSTFHPKTLLEILLAIKSSLAEQQVLVDGYNRGLDLNLALISAFQG